MKRATLTPRAGFSIVEIVVVIGLLLIVSGLLFSGFREYMAFQQHSQAMNEVKLLIQESQTAARLSVGGVAHGIKIEASQLTPFVGDTYNSSDPDNQVTTFNTVTLTPYLSGGTDEIIFTILSGYPSATGTIDVSGTSYNYTDSLEVRAGGVVQ